MAKYYNDYTEEIKRDMKKTSPNAAQVSRSIAEAAPIVSEPGAFAFSASPLTHPQLAHLLDLGVCCPENLFCEFVHAFDCAEVPASALMRITADSTYRVWINGVDAGSGPIRGRNCRYFDTREIAPLLHPGSNEIKILVHSPVERHCLGHSRDLALLVEAPGLFKSDASWQVSFCPEFAREVPVYGKQIGFMEMCDMRKRHDRAYLPAAVIPQSERRYFFRSLKPRDIPALEVTEEYPKELCTMAALPCDDVLELTQLAEFLDKEPWETLATDDFDGKIIPDGKSIALVWDFDKVIIGRLKLEVNASAGTIVDVVYGERPSNKPDGMNGRLCAEYRDYPKLYRFNDRYILADGYNCIGTTLFERGFRFVEVVFRNFTAPIEVLNICAENRVYPLRQQCFFRCSDKSLTDIYEQCVTTMRACTTDVFINCPWREHTFWVKDMLVDARVSLALFGASALQARALRLAFSAGDFEGIMFGVSRRSCKTDGAPHIHRLDVAKLALVMVLADYYRYGGDATVVRELLPKCEFLIWICTDHLDGDGLLREDELWWYIDSSDEFNGSRPPFLRGNKQCSLNGCPESISNLLYVMATRTIVTLAAQCGYQLKNEEPEKYLKLSKRTALAVKKHLYSRHRGKIADWVRLNKEGKSVFSSVSQAFALLANIGSRQEQELFRKALTNYNVQKPELNMYSVVFEAMARHGKIKQALAIIRKYWGRILDAGYSTIFEVGVHSFPSDGVSWIKSMCYGASTSPAAFLREHVLGLSPLLGSDGKCFAFHPALGDLKWAEGELHGDENAVVRVKLTRDEITIVLPAGYSAQLPNGTVLAEGTHHLDWDALS